MLSLGGVVGLNGWWSVFIMCVLGSWHDRALGHWHGNSPAITPAVQRSGGCGYMGHRRPQSSHRYGWKVGFCSFSSPLFFFPPLWVSWRKGRKKARSSAPGQCSPSMCPALSLFPSPPDFLLLAFQSTTPSSLLSLSGRLVNSLSPFLPGSNAFSLFLPIFSPPPRKRIECTSGISFFHFFSKGRLLCTNTVQTRLPSVLSPFETPCSLNTICLKRMPSAFLLHSHSSGLAHSFAFSHIHKHGHIRLTILHALKPTDSHQNTHACTHTYINIQHCRL